MAERQRPTLGDPRYSAYDTALAEGDVSSIPLSSAPATTEEQPKSFPELAIEELRAGREEAREDLSPFREAGEAQLPGLTSLISDPQAQAQFIQQNPFFKALADRAQQRIFSSQAARGKVGTGGTAEALQTSLLGLGTDLLSQNIAQRQNLVNTGAAAAAGQATVAQQTASGVSDLYTQMENMRQANRVASANRQTSLISGGLQTAGLIYALSDKRYKKDIKKVGHLDNGLPLYKFKYKGDDKVHINVMAQDVEKVNPSAVIEINDVKYVDMENVDAS